MTSSQPDDQLSDALAQLIGLTLFVASEGQPKEAQQRWHALRAFLDEQLGDCLHDYLEDRSVAQHLTLESPIEWIVTLINIATALPHTSNMVMSPNEEMTSYGRNSNIARGIMAANQFLWAEKFHEARLCLGQTETEARTSHLDLIPYVLAVVAELNFRTGSWRSGRVATEEGQKLAMRANGTDRDKIRALLIAQTARFDAVAGEVHTCLERI